MKGFFFSSRRRHTRSLCDWSSDVCSSDLPTAFGRNEFTKRRTRLALFAVALVPGARCEEAGRREERPRQPMLEREAHPEIAQQRVADFCEREARTGDTQAGDKLEMIPSCRPPVDYGHEHH